MGDAATKDSDVGIDVVRKCDTPCTSSTGHDDFDFLKPLLFPSRTTHRRLIPKGSKHAFAYPYFLVGVPVIHRSSTGPGTSSLEDANDQNLVWRWRSLSVHASDYLARGSRLTGGLRGKLEEYLITQNAKPEVYPYAYLVTAPRFWGYSFNPISFWYLHGSDRRLKAMIMEVNNTFDERRSYFLEGMGNSDGRFKQEWTKDFHVSPFNDRLGSYSASVLDLFPHGDGSGEGEGRADYWLDNTIVLKDPAGAAKLVTRIFSASSPLDPAALTWWQATSFLARWAWIGLLTDIRILKEARKLWMVKKLSVFYRPEPKATSIGRKAIEEEVEIEAVFRRWLQDVADARPVDIRYTPAAGDDCGRTVEIRPLKSSSVVEDSDQRPVVETTIQVLTPEFYRQLIRTTDMLPVFTKYGSGADDDQTTIIISDCLALNSAVRASFDGGSKADIPNTWRWRMVQSLRAEKSLVKVLYDLAVSISGFSGAVDRVPAMSQLDHIALSKPSPPQHCLAWEKGVWSLLLADRLAFGSVQLLRVLIAVMQLMLLAVALFVGAVWLKA